MESIITSSGISSWKPLFLCNLLWFVGIHGALIITGIMNPFWLTYLFENQRALAAGEAVLPHIYFSSTALSGFVLP
jgi:cellobiose-specific phosphotransferase system component IIC